MPTSTFIVRKAQLGSTEFRTVPDAPLAEGRVRVAIERFALTANNITYAAFGDAMDYWRFFPVAAADGSADPEWGCVPVWGFGTVEASAHAEVAVGERLYGYFPMADRVELSPTRLSAAGFSDGAPHRAALHPVYNAYQRCATDPFYRADTEGLQALLRPLFTTSWLIDDFLADNAWFGAGENGARPRLLLSSASSKTAFGTAWCMARRGGAEVVGLTSARNRAYCESLGCYDRVLAYDELDRLERGVGAVYVDFAGNGGFRKALHEHCTGLRYSCSVGGAHVGALGGGRDLPGPKPTLFFAPAQIKKRNAEWGAAVLGERLVAAWQDFLDAVRRPDPPWLRVHEQHGAAAVQATYLAMLAGQGDPREGQVLALG